MLAWEILPCHLFLCCPHSKTRGQQIQWVNSLRNWPYRVMSQYLKALIRYVSEPLPLVNFNQGQFLTSSLKHSEFGHWVHRWPSKTKYQPNGGSWGSSSMGPSSVSCGLYMWQLFRTKLASGAILWRSERPICGLLAFASCCFPAGLACWMALQLIKYKVFWLACAWLSSWKAA